jgi:hypothetical protein
MSDIDEAVLEDLDLESDDEDDDESAEDDSSEFNPLDPLGVFSSGGPLGIFNRGGRRTSTAPNRSYYTPQMQSPFVTQPQFSSALNKIRADVSKNAEAIKTVDVRVATEQAVNKAQNTALGRQSKINKKQTRQIATLKRSVQQQQQNALLLMLLTRPKSVTLTAPATIGGVTLQSGARLLYEEGSDNSMLMAMLLMGGLGGDSSSLAMLAFAGAF